MGDLATEAGGKPERLKPYEVIARLLSNVHPPSLTALRRAHQIVNSLDFHGYSIADKP